MLQHQLNVNLPNNPYPIYIGSTIFNDPNLLAKHIGGKQVMIVTNNRIAPLYLNDLKQALNAYQCDFIILPDGESYKTLVQWQEILNALANYKHHRDSTLITLGGGVIGDMGGFAAACYQRGIAFLQIPTTLLAQVDASIGGKTAVNHPMGKNFIGAFYQPNAVIIDSALLKSLPTREVKAGLAEIVKAALINDAEFFLWLEQNYRSLMNLQNPALSDAIYRACEIKKNIVVADEKEQNIRALLNLGHTFAHAIERELKYGTWLHGEAVAMGLVLAAKLSEQRGTLATQDRQRIEDLLTKMELPTQLPNTMSKECLLQAMQMDKKVKHNQLIFILLDAIGSAFICKDITLQELAKL